MININNAVQFQHVIWDRLLEEAQVIVDATCGNGHDLLYLAEKAKDGAHLYAIDIQEQAIQNTRSIMAEAKVKNKTSITYIQGSHDQAIDHCIEEDYLDLLVFNLGYLPGADHSLMTKADQTLAALDSALPKLSRGGLISLVAYPGTPQGAEEEKALQGYIARLNQKDFNACHWSPLNQINQPPVIYLIQKR